MKMQQSLHNHTTFCDGKNTAQEMVEAAIAKNLKSIGISSHAPLPYENDYCMSPQNLPAYITEIQKLKEKYDSQIQIFLGLEIEGCFEFDKKQLDYTISSIHSTYKNGITVDVDNTKEMFVADIAKHYDGDYLACVKDYYDLVVKAAKNGDILGHFDLVTKFNGENQLFDENSKEYQEIAFAALDKCLETNIIFEVNTGVIAKGYRKIAYPAPIFLEYIHQKNGKIIITADAHTTDGIDFYYSETVEILKNIGFKKQQILTKTGFKEINL